MRKLVVFLTGLGVVVGGAGQLAAGVVGYWRFEEGLANNPATGNNSVLDSSGNGLHGTPVNGPVYRADFPVSPVPKTGASNAVSMDFQGNIGQAVNIPDGPLFQLTNSFTIEAYIKPRALADQQREIFFRGDARAGLDPYAFYLSPGNQVNQLTLRISDASNAWGELSAALQTPLNQWVHVAGVLDDASSTMKLYVNGSLEASLVTPVRPFAILDPTKDPGVSIGNVQNAQLFPPDHFLQCFNGLIDEVRLSDVALRPDQFLNAPEPSTLALFGGLGAVTLLAYAWRRRKRASL